MALCVLSLIGGTIGIRRHYGRDMLKMYGPEMVAELNRLRVSLRKVTNAEFLEVLNEYKAVAQPGRRAQEGKVT